MQKKAIILTYIWVLFSPLSWATSSPATAVEPKIPFALPTSSDDVKTKQGWLAHMQKELPVFLCREDEYFIQCFKTNKQECIDFSKVLVDACLSNIKLALPEDMSNQGEHWGQLTGRCSYDLYEKFMQSKKRDLPACQKTEPAKNETPPKKNGS